MNESILPKGTLVSVTSYGPFFGCKGTIRAIELIAKDDPSPVPFYLVVLHEGLIKELWLEYDAVTAVEGNIVSKLLAV